LAPVFEAVRFAAVDVAAAFLAVVVLADADLAGVVLAVADLAGVDLVAVDLAVGGLAEVDLGAADLVDLFALVALAADCVVVDCAGANAARAANRATGMEVAIARKDPV
jgi:uncharacterized protein YjbI with pentapeptide repeats